MSKVKGGRQFGICEAPLGADGCLPAVSSGQEELEDLLQFSSVQRPQSCPTLGTHCVDCSTGFTQISSV